MQKQATTAERALAWGQGAYYVATGVWPIVHLRSFEAITGPKPEGWLVKTVGALVAVVGGALWRGAARKKISSDLKLIAAGAAAALAIVDIVYPAKRRISPVYLLDAAPELFMVGAWWWTGRARA